MHDLSKQETATILAALRDYLRRPSSETDDIATDGGTLEPLDADSINALAERLNLGEPPELKPVEWIESGELNTKEIENQDDILGQCGRLLDGACSHDIIGPVLFKADDGKHYCVTVEAVIGEASEEWVKEALEEAKGL
jgi:hypothetical protein